MVTTHQVNALWLNHQPLCGRMAKALACLLYSDYCLPCLAVVLGDSTVLMALSEIEGLVEGFTDL